MARLRRSKYDIELSNGNSNFLSDFTAGETTAMPVSWLNVSAEKFGKQDVVVKWSTAKKVIQNDYFEIQYAQDGLDFETAGLQKGSGNHIKPNIISIPASECFGRIQQVIYFRIKQVDYNGEFSYSNIVSVKAKSSAEVVVYPVPLTYLCHHS